MLAYFLLPSNSITDSVKTKIKNHDVEKLIYLYSLCNGDILTDGEYLEIIKDLEQKDQFHVTLHCLICLMIRSSYTSNDVYSHVE